MTPIQRVTFGAAAWQPRRNPRRAVMPIVVTVESFPADWLTVDLARELARRVSWATVGENVVPADALPHGVLNAESAKRVMGGFVLELDSNQPAPEYVESNALPDTAAVRVNLIQPLSSDLDDLPVLLARRRDVRDALAVMTGEIGA